MRTLLLLAALTALSAAPVQRDWQLHPAIVQLDSTGDIFAVGDVHGDRERLVDLLSGAGIVDRSARPPAWSAGRAILVFTGDLIDKGPDALGVIALLRSLEPQAARAGGRLIVLMGNHEAEFLAEPAARKSQEFAAELRHAGMKPAEVAACRGEVGQFFCSLPLAAKVNDWFFSHAGNSGGRSIDRLSADIRRAVDSAGFGAPELAGDNSLLEARYGERGPNGRSWIEGEGRLDRYAAALGVTHIVQGHHHGDVQFDDGARRRTGEIYQWRGRLFLIDTGMSREIDDSLGAVLHIGGGKPHTATAICADGRTTTLWDERKAAESAGAICHAATQAR
jgi:hypothetical protein